MFNGRALSVIALTSILGMACGCGKGGGVAEVARVNVSGKVTLDGKPLEKGYIMFVSTDTKAATEPASGDIKDGSFSLAVPAGSKIVQITSPKVIGKRKKYKDDPNSPEVDEVEEMIPAQYNKKSKITKDISSSSADLGTIELKSK